jgi:transposase
VDVAKAKAKAKLDVALLGHAEKVKFHVFGNDRKGFAALVAWLMEHGCVCASTHVCLEATGPHDEALATALSDEGWFVSVVNPARVKGFAQSQMARNKTDRADTRRCSRTLPAPCSLRPGSPRRPRCVSSGRWWSGCRR